MAVVYLNSSRLRAMIQVAKHPYRVLEKLSDDLSHLRSGATLHVVSANGVYYRIQQECYLGTKPLISARIAVASLCESPSELASFSVR
jgi:hypothetical protein